MQVLSVASSLNPGHDLWILTEPSLSKWPLRLDWYMNFQIHRSSHHESYRRSEALESLLKSIDWDLPHQPLKENRPLLFGCEGHLPARWLSVIPGASGPLENWTESIHKVWQGLGEPNFKVFLPAGLQAPLFAEAWKRKSKFEDFSLVLDQDPRMTVP